MRLFIFFVTANTMARGLFMSIGNHSVGAFSDLEFPNDREDCKDEAWLQEIGEHQQLVRREAANKMHSIRMRNNFVQLRSFCDCETQYNLVDLGEGHYPRLITMTKCKAKSCANKFYQCRNFVYGSNVLVKRSMNSTLKDSSTVDVLNVEELPLPDSLQDNWELLALSIPVACIAVERT